MEFEDIEHKYKVQELRMPVWEAKVALVKKLTPQVINMIESGAREVLIGYFRDECMARNTALALEFYKVHNKA